MLDSFDPLVNADVQSQALAIYHQRFNPETVEAHRQTTMLVEHFGSVVDNLGMWIQSLQSGDG